MSGAAGRYAAAVFELGRDSGSLDTLESELGALKALIGENDDLARLIASPAYGREEQAAAMTAVMEKMGSNALTRKFVGLMAAKGRLHALPDAIDGFSAMLAEHRGEMTADVVSAKPLSDMQRKALAKNLKASVGKDVRIEESVDPSLLGGLVVKIGSKMIDASLKAKLAGLRLAMREA